MGDKNQTIAINNSQGIILGDNAQLTQVINQPRSDTSQSEQPAELSSMPRIAIIVPLKEEFRELFQKVRDKVNISQDPEYGHSLYDFVYSVSGPKKIDYQCRAILIGEMGNVDAAIATERLVNGWKPSLTSLVGIAGSMDNDVFLGDVVFPTIVDEYMNSAKASPSADGSGFELRLSGKPYNASHEFNMKMKHFEFDHESIYSAWREACFRDLDNLISKDKQEELRKAGLIRFPLDIPIGHVASGDIVAGDQAYIDWLRRCRDRKYLAIEMEAAGVMASVTQRLVPRRSLILRGVSDYGDTRKKQLDEIGRGGLRRFAVRNAIRLLWLLMDTGLLLERSPS